MRVRKVVNKPFRRKSEGVSIAGGVNAVISANVDEEGARTETSSRQRVTNVSEGGKDTPRARSTGRTGSGVQDQGKEEA